MAQFGFACLVGYSCVNELFASISGPSRDELFLVSGMQRIDLSHEERKYEPNERRRRWKFMGPYPTEELRVELNELLRKQREVSESRMLGTASDDGLLEYEMRQEIIHELCNVLVHSGTT
jgi:hypothetical protein